MKQFIRNVRAAKTIADERAVIQKESAAIRASFREESHDHNVRYIQIRSTQNMTGGESDGVSTDATMSQSYYIFSLWVSGRILVRSSV